MLRAVAVPERRVALHVADEHAAQALGVHLGPRGAVGKCARDIGLDLVVLRRVA